MTIYDYIALETLYTAFAPRIHQIRMNVVLAEARFNSLIRSWPMNKNLLNLVCIRLDELNEANH